MCRLIGLIFLLTGLLINCDIALAQKHLNAGAVATQQTTPALWKQDMGELKKHLEHAHPNLFHRQNEVHIEQAFKRVSSQVGLEHRLINLAQAMASIGDGHTALPLISMPLDMGFTFQSLPLQLRHFSDGYFVIGASSNYQHLIGSQLTNINALDIQQVTDKTNRLISSDNTAWKEDLSAYYLMVPKILLGLNVVKNTDAIQLKFRNNDEELDIEIQQSDYIANINWFTDFFTQPSSDQWSNFNLDSPLLTCRKNYCAKSLTDIDALYLNIRAMRNDQSQDFQSFIDNNFAELASSGKKNLIIDLRLNRGGSGSMRWPLIYRIIQDKITNPYTVYVLIGKKVFSAGMMLAVDLEKHANAIFIGETTGTSPNHYGETTFYTLPNSGIKIMHSGLYWQNSRPDDNRQWIKPHHPITNSSKAFFSGTDESYQLLTDLLKKSTKSN